jgi:hypothetical protein
MIKACAVFFITKLFKITDVKITSTTKSNLDRLPSTQYNHNQNKHEKCGIYQLICTNCNKKDIGQTGRRFHIRFQEHFRDYKHKNNKSKFAQHLLENEHSVGPMESIMDIVHATSTGRMPDTLVQFYIYKETKRNNQIKDKLTVKPNVIFETLVQKESHRLHITSEQPDHPHVT